VNVFDLLRKGGDPAAVALVDRSCTPPARRTYAELIDAALGFAGGLTAQGLGRGDRVGVLADNSEAYLVAVFGTLAAGGAVVPLNTRLPRETQDDIAADAGLRLVVVDHAHAHLTPAGVRSVPMAGPDWDALRHGPALDAPVECGGDEVAVHLYTSGSTGRPKGVLLSHHNIVWTCEHYGVAIPGEVMLVSAPLYHKNASMASKLSFVNGGTVVLLPRFSARGYLDAIEEERVTMCSGVPTMYALVTAELAGGGRPVDLSSVRTVLIGSAPLTEALHDDVQALFPQARVTNGYGTTEAVLEFGPHPDGLTRPKIALGHQHPSVELRLVDPVTGEAGDHGELWVRSPGVMAGYHERPELNAERLTDGWYHTGDLMRRDADGWYFFVGRVDDMFVCAGENIYPDAVEQLLERHPGVHQAVVVPIPDDLKGALPAAFVRVEPGAALTGDEVRRWALDHGPAYAHPRRVWFLDEIPLASTNKIDRRALIEEARKRAVTEPGGVPGS
jgi:long-chain acyl-CoA synthetase